MSGRILVVAVAVLWTAPALAQPREKRFSAWFNGGAQAAMPRLRDEFTFEKYVEDARVDGSYRAKAALLVEGGFAVRLRRAIAIGISISRFSGEGRADVAAQIPAPFEFNRLRDVSGTASNLDHTETAYHVHLRYTRPLMRHLRLVASAGPTAFNVRRQIVSDVQVDESYPYDTAAFRSAGTRAAKGTGVGLSVGADIIWMPRKGLGAGALVRYARGTADLKGPSRKVSVDTGGIQSGIGLRVYF